MTKLLTLPTQIVLLLIAIVLISTIELSQATSSGNMHMPEMTADNDDADVQEERRSYDLHKLRHFLLTSNAEQLTAKREQQDFYKRELIREYLRSISDPDPNRFQEVKKRFKTYCNSYEDLMNSNWAACG